jgi:hypothetical protein
MLMCAACGTTWRGTAAERAQAKAADAAHEAECAAEREAEEARLARKRARAMFAAAGRPVPAWAREEE